MIREGTVLTDNPRIRDRADLTRGKRFSIVAGAVVVQKFGFTSCGRFAGFVVTGTTERFDDTANTQTGRLDATARYSPIGYSFNNFGFSSCGKISVVTGITERFDDIANTQTGRLAATARETLAGYSTI